MDTGQITGAQSRFTQTRCDLATATARGGETIELGTVRARSRELVQAADLDAVVAMALNALHRLHEGNIARSDSQLSFVTTIPRALLGVHGDTRRRSTNAG